VLGDLVLGQLHVEPQHDRGAMVETQPGQCVEQVGVDRRHICRRCESTRETVSDGPASQEIATPIHDRALQVRTRLVELGPPVQERDERVVHHILRDGS